MKVINRIGIIKYSFNFIEDHPEVLQRIYSKVVPLEIKASYVYDSFEVVCMSKEFDVLTEEQLKSAQYPTYTVSLRKQKSSGKEAIHVKFKKTMKAQIVVNNMVDKKTESKTQYIKNFTIGDHLPDTSTIVDGHYHQQTFDNVALAISATKPKDHLLRWNSNTKIWEKCS